jgi:hypothetical protein
MINGKSQLKRAEALWNMYVAFREAVFSESQAMYFCGELLTSQGGK